MVTHLCCATQPNRTLRAADSTASAQTQQQTPRDKRQVPKRDSARTFFTRANAKRSAAADPVATTRSTGKDSERVSEAAKPPGDETEPEPSRKPKSRARMRAHSRHSTGQTHPDTTQHNTTTSAAARRDETGRDAEQRHRTTSHKKTDKKDPNDQNLTGDQLISEYTDTHTADSTASAQTQQQTPRDKRQVPKRDSARTFFTRANAKRSAAADPAATTRSTGKDSERVSEAAKPPGDETEPETSRKPKSRARMRVHSRHSAGQTHPNTTQHNTTQQRAPQHDGTERRAEQSKDTGPHLTKRQTKRIRTTRIELSIALPTELRSGTVRPITNLPITTLQPTTQQHTRTQHNNTTTHTASYTRASLPRLPPTAARLPQPPNTNETNRDDTVRPTAQRAHKHNSKRHTTNAKRQSETLRAPSSRANTKRSATADPAATTRSTGKDSERVSEAAKPPGDETEPETSRKPKSRARMRVHSRHSAGQTHPNTTQHNTTQQRAPQHDGTERRAEQSKDTGPHLTKRQTKRIRTTRIELSIALPTELRSGTVRPITNLPITTLQPTPQQHTRTQHNNTTTHTASYTRASLPRLPPTAARLPQPPNTNETNRDDTVRPTAQRAHKHNSKRHTTNAKRQSETLRAPSSRANTKRSATADPAATTRSTGKDSERVSEAAKPPGDETEPETSRTPEKVPPTAATNRCKAPTTAKHKRDQPRRHSAADSTASAQTQQQTPHDKRHTTNAKRQSETLRAPSSRANTKRSATADPAATTRSTGKDSERVSEAAKPPGDETEPETSRKPKSRARMRVHSRHSAGQTHPNTTQHNTTQHNATTRAAARRDGTQSRADIYTLQSIALPTELRSGTVRPITNLPITTLQPTPQQHTRTQHNNTTTHTASYTRASLPRLPPTAARLPQPPNTNETNRDDTVRPTAQRAHKHNSKRHTTNAKRQRETLRAPSSRANTKRSATADPAATTRSTGKDSERVSEAAKPPGDETEPETSRKPKSRARMRVHSRHSAGQTHPNTTQHNTTQQRAPQHDGTERRAEQTSYTRASLPRLPPTAARLPQPPNTNETNRDDTVRPTAQRAHKHNSKRHTTNAKRQSETLRAPSSRANTKRSVTADPAATTRSTGKDSERVSEAAKPPGDETEPETSRKPKSRARMRVHSRHSAGQTHPNTTQHNATQQRAPQHDGTERRAEQNSNTRASLPRLPPTAARLPQPPNTNETNRDDTVRPTAQRAHKHNSKRHTTNAKRQSETLRAPSSRANTKRSVTADPAATTRSTGKDSERVSEAAKPPGDETEPETSRKPKSRARMRVHSRHSAGQTHPNTTQHNTTQQRAPQHDGTERRAEQSKDTGPHLTKRQTKRIRTTRIELSIALPTELRSGTVRPITNLPITTLQPTPQQHTRTQHNNTTTHTASNTRASLPRLPPTAARLPQPPNTNETNRDDTVRPTAQRAHKHNSKRHTTNAKRQSETLRAPSSRANTKRSATADPAATTRSTGKDSERVSEAAKPPGDETEPETSRKPKSRARMRVHSRHSAGQTHPNTTQHNTTQQRAPQHDGTERRAEQSKDTGPHLTKRQTKRIRTTRIELVTN
ncbi:hypothetical protein FI667_g7742, partial [Globisporangium splendens]